MEQKKTLVALLLDYDSCWSPTGHGQQPKDKSLIDVNADLIDHFKEILHTHHAKKCVLASFSQRQTFRGDLRNSGQKNNPLSFGVFTELARRLPALIMPQDCHFYYDTYLTRETFGPALNKIEEKKNRSVCSPLLSLFFSSCTRSKKSDKEIISKYRTVFDRSKILISVALINKIANENPDYNIVVNIYDDMHGDDIAFDILKAQYTFFNKHPELIPANVTLHFYHRINDAEEKFVKKLVHIITGNREHPIDHQQLILDLATQATRAEYGDSLEIHPDLLLNVANTLPKDLLTIELNCKKAIY